MAAASAANLALARTYRDEVLTEQRTGFYEQLRRATEQWLKGGRSLEAGAALVPTAPAPAETHANARE
jgi:hypothetical protein